MMASRSPLHLHPRPSWSACPELEQGGQCSFFYEEGSGLLFTPACMSAQLVKSTWQARARVERTRSGSMLVGVGCPPKKAGCSSFTYHRMVGHTRVVAVARNTINTVPPLQREGVLPVRAGVKPAQTARCTMAWPTHLITDGGAPSVLHCQNDWLELVPCLAKVHAMHSK